jgi:hypothetical protein
VANRDRRESGVRYQETGGKIPANSIPVAEHLKSSAKSSRLQPCAAIPITPANSVRSSSQFGGWSLYVKDGKAKYAYNWLARNLYTIEATEKLPEGKVTLVYDFDYDGGGLHKGGTGTLIVNGKKVGEGRIDKTMGALYSLAAETADVGKDAYSPVTKDYDPWNNAFTGTIKSVKIKLKGEPAKPTIQEEQEESDLGAQD